MPLLLLKDLPRYECLQECAKVYPGLEPSACEAFLHLLRAGDEAFRVMDEHFHAAGLSQGRFTVLMLLLDKPGPGSLRLSPAQLAEHSGVTRATMTGLIDTLERDGLVRRLPDPADRRAWLVEMTPKGIKFITRLLPEHFHRISALFAPLGETERRTFVRLLAKIAAQASKAYPAAAHHSSPSAKPRVS